jgi:rod shape-determining protein MreC
MTNRPYSVALGLVALLSLALLNLPESGASRVKLAVGGLFLPLFGLAGSLQGMAANPPASISSRSQIVRENERLNQENQQLRLRLLETEEVRRENNRLREAVQWQRRTPGQFKFARVVGQDPANWWRSLLLNAGRRDGIRPSLPVLTEEGLVGRISEVGFDRCRVLLVGDPNCRVAAQVVTGPDRRTVAKGILTANSSTLDRLLVDLTYIPGSALLQPGQEVITSGDGGVFPKGLPVGRVVDVRTNDYGLYLEARIKLAVNFNRLEEAWVLLQ